MEQLSRYRKPVVAALVVGVVGLACGASMAVPEQGLTLAEAKKVMDVATGFAREHGAPGGAIAIVDAGGSVVLLERLDGTFPSASRISVGKAQTAAMFRKPTKAFEDAINGGRIAMAALPDFYPLQGGVPLLRGDVVVGAIGVSGAASADQDNQIAMAAAAAVAALAEVDGPEEPAVSWFAADDVRDAFARGTPLFEGAGFKVNPSRRDEPGEAEVHLRDTDVFYVVGGSATLVTGGRLIAARKTADNELRGAAIEQGQTRTLASGDVVVIPRGVPHWFREVAEPFVYYTVKVAGAKS